MGWLILLDFGELGAYPSYPRSQLVESSQRQTYGCPHSSVIESQARAYELESPLSE
jgi:hypothetical protein